MLDATLRMLRENFRAALWSNSRFFHRFAHTFINPKSVVAMTLMDPASWMFVLVVSMVCSIACAIISMKKEYRGAPVFAWFVAGFFLSVFALIAIILAPHHHEA